jgi:hypothetical protein
VHSFDARTDRATEVFHMTTAHRTRCDLLAARKAAPGTLHVAGGYAEAVDAAGVATVAGDSTGVRSGDGFPIAWNASLRSRNIVATVVTPAA